MHFVQMELQIGSVAQQGFLPGHEILWLVHLQKTVYQLMREEHGEVLGLVLLLSRIVGNRSEGIYRRPFRVPESFAKQIASLISVFAIHGEIIDVGRSRQVRILEHTSRTLRRKIIAQKHVEQIVSQPLLLRYIFQGLIR